MAIDNILSGPRIRVFWFRLLCVASIVIGLTVLLVGCGDDVEQKENGREESGNTLDTTKVGASTVTVVVVDGGIQMPTTLPAGVLTVDVANNGTKEHSLEIEGNGIDQPLNGNLEPGKGGVIQVDLVPGTYRFFCPVKDHDGEQVQVTAR